MPTLNILIDSVVIHGDSSVLVIFDMNVCLNNVGAGGYTLDDFSISAMNADNWEFGDGTYRYPASGVDAVDGYSDRVIVHGTKLFENGITYYLYPSTSIKNEGESYSYLGTVKEFVGEYTQGSTEDRISNKKYSIPKKRSNSVLYAPGLILDKVRGIDLFDSGSDSRRIVFRRITLAPNSLWHDKSFGAGIRPKSINPQSAYEIKRLVQRQMDLDGNITNVDVSVSVSQSVTKIYVRGKIFGGADFSASVETGANADYA